MPIRAKITSVSGWVPPHKLTNQDLEKMVDTTDDWIVARTGIKERRILKGEGKGTSYMAAKAVQDLLKKRGISPEEIEVVICATVTPDMFFPSTANLICEKVGAKNAMSFDLAAACSGFLYALETGNNYIKSGMYRKVIVVGADKMSSITNYKDRNNCIIFGDGAGAVLLEPSENDDGIIDAILKSDSHLGKNLIFMKGGGSAYPANSKNGSLLPEDYFVFQDGRNVFKHAVTNMADVSEKIMQKNQLKGEDIAFLIPHQANRRIIEAAASRTSVAMDRVTINIEKYGNTTAATIPLCLWEWEDQFQKGDNIILAAFGAGFTWGSIYLKWAY